MLLGTSPIEVWYYHKNISYTILFSEFLIWGFKIYMINSNKVNKAFDPHTNNNPQTFPPDIDPSMVGNPIQDY